MEEEIINVPGYEIILTDKEIEERKNLEKAHQGQINDALVRAENRKNAFKKLEKLGLTQDEIQAIIRIN